MTTPAATTSSGAQSSPGDSAAHAAAAARSNVPVSANLFTYLRLARLKQWTKGAFVFLGALYSQKLFLPSGEGLFPALAAFLAFGLASSACYIFNDLRDLDADRAHPRKRLRPIAAGLIAPARARVFAVVLLLLAAAAVALMPVYPDPKVPASTMARGLLAITLGLYVINTLAYTRWLKHAPVADVMSLALGFVLRVFAGCAAVAVEPSSWLLNCTFFLSMFLALGKRLGERRAFGDGEAALTAAAAARGVQALYTTDLLRMGTVVTAVATLLTYAGYVQDQAHRYTWGFNLLWLTILPATYGLLRCMLMVDRGVFDDPTELATKDRPFQTSILVFGALTIALMISFRGPAV